MIRLTTRFGFMACRYLANNYYENRYVSAPEIAEHFNINVRALMPSLRQLTRVGILRSRVGGKSPGFIFTKEPNQLTLYEIYIALEGSIQFECCKDLVSCLACNYNANECCDIFILFQKAIDNASTLFQSVTVAEYAGSLYKQGTTHR